MLPGVWANPLTAISAHSIQKSRTPAKCSSGIAAMADAHTASEAMATRRRPIRSMTGPPISAATTIGRVAQKATSPARPALPVVSRTNQGTPIRVSEVPAVEMELAASVAASGVRFPMAVSPPRWPGWPRWS